MNTRALNIAAFSAAAMLIGLAVAGPITPLAGPIAPTMKPLNEVEPRIAIGAANTPGDASCLYKITQPGSYYLTGKITGVAGKTAIIVNAHNVTIDLCGYQITGGTTAIGCLVPPPAGVVTNTTIRNGQVDACSDVGIKLDHSFAAVIEKMQVQGCGSTGIQVDGNSIVRDCTVNGSGGGFKCSSDAHFINCTSMNSTGDAFATGWTCMLDHCIAHFCDGIGFKLGSQCTLRDSQVYHSGGNGVETSNDCLVDRTMVSNSQTKGMLVTSGTTVRDCQISGGLGDGIAVGDECVITGNIIHDNAQTGGAGTGLRVTGNNGVIQDNRVSGNGQYGIWVNGTGNLVVRNWARGNGGTNFYAAAGNDSAAPINAPGAGFTAGTAWTNFTR